MQRGVHLAAISIPLQRDPSSDVLVLSAGLAEKYRTATSPRRVLGVSKINDRIASMFLLNVSIGSTLVSLPRYRRLT